MSVAPTVSMVKDAYSIETQDVPADKVIAAIRNGRWRDYVGEIRQEADKETADKYKACLPGVLFSGKFSERKNHALVQHSGLLCADLDNLNGELQNAREKLLSSPYLWALFTSPSGEGLKAVFRVRPDGATHRGSYRAVEHHVKDLTGIHIDEACKDPARLCFVSHDPAAYYNPDAQELTPLPEPEKARQAQTDGELPPDMPLRERIASELLGLLSWSHDKAGYFCRCPGEARHTKRTAEKHTIVYLDTVPTVKCQHSSCLKIIEAFNAQLRSLVRKAEYSSPEKLKRGAKAVMEAKPPVQPRPLGQLLDATCEFFRRYVIFQHADQAIICALWAIHSWFFEAFNYTPYLHVYSAEKRSGKTRLLDCLELLVKEPWRAVSPSEAVLYRRVERLKPTLLLDEVDTIFSNTRGDRTEYLRSLLNAGFECGAKVPRCVGKGADLNDQDFSVFCPKALSGIGKVLHDTVDDRCLKIELVRKAREEGVARFRKRKAQAEVGDIRAELEALAQQSALIEALRDAEPALPDELTDRAQDIAEPLLAIADLAGGEWPEKARNALVGVCCQEEDASKGVQLLAAMWNIFEAVGDKVPTKEALERLIAIEDGPWALMFEDAVRRDKLQTAAAKLAKLLKPYKIKPRPIRLGDEIVKGYYRADFEKHWKRYLPSAPPPHGNSGYKGYAVTYEGENVTPGENVTVTSENSGYTTSRRETGKCNSVTAVTPTQEKREWDDKVAGIVNAN